MANGLSVPSSFGVGGADVHPPRPLLYVPPWLRLEERDYAPQAGVWRCGIERDKRPPKAWNDWCLTLGGRNLYGEPVLRIGWSETTTVLVGGVWSKWDASGNKTGEAIEYRKIPKYPGISERWVLEMWMPPETCGTPESWETTWKRRAEWGEPFQLLPLFPSRGDFVHIATFSDPQTGGYSEPTWDDLPGLYAVQMKWREKDPLERYFELRDQLERLTAARDEEVFEASLEVSSQMRAEAMAELGIRSRVSLAGVDVPGRSSS